ncbi:MAG TPA: molybdopterin cofactor-binding domain-containing protein [Ramlibacter sp.]|nr:molybdopterin cofactor-binding domain-containing protein [Ramlibacter sp.]
MANAAPEGLTRRAMLAAGGSLVVAFSLRPDHVIAQEPGTQGPKNDGPKLPGSLDKTPMLDAWIRIDADGKVTVFSGKAELGQGIKTALIQVAAEELVVNPSRITLVTADTQRTANEGYTAGSHSMQDSATAIRNAAAQVRAILVGLAAQKLGVPRETLKVEDGVVTGDSRQVPYGELVSGQDLHVKATPNSPLRDPASHTVMGKDLQRIDIPAKVTGGVAYVQDLRLPNMAHGRIVRPPSPSAALASLDTATAEKLPGVLKVVRDGRFIGVIAQREWQAITAAKALARGARWQERETLPVQADLYKTVRAAPAKDIVLVDRGTAAATDGKSISAEYLRPYQLHASIGPSCAVAQLVDGNYTVWTHSQGVFPLRKALAELLGQGEDKLRCIHVEGSGCYGHNAADDVAADAALLARALPGRPVRVQWMREDEHMWEPYGPPMVSSARATLDANGSIASWQYEVWSNTHNARPGKAGDLLAGQHLAQGFAPSPPQPGNQPDGLGDRNSIPLYTLPNAKVVYHFLPEMPLRVSALRSLGAYMNVFSIESFMDELARAAGADPVAFRLKHLTDGRARDVINLAAEKFGWSGFQRRAGRGRGFAFARYKNQAGFLALACEVEVRRDTGEVKLLRVVAAADSGEVVNPDGIRNQIEGGVVQASSWTLSEEVTFDNTRITSRDWGGYPILRFPQVPERIDVHIVPRPGQPFLGTGEVAQGPTPAMIANAVADATGARLRQLPFSRERVRKALEA